MTTQFAVSSSQVLLGILLILIVITVVIFGGRIAMRRRSNQLLDDARAKHSSPVRTKYASVDVMQYSPTFRILGLALTLLALLLMVNWTTFDEKIDIPEGGLTLDEEIMVEPPRTTTPPPPPPPPPPPVIEEVPNEMIVDLEDELEFMDQSIDAETIVEVPVQQSKSVEAVAPPPPPPPIEDEVEEIFKIVEEMPRFPGCDDIDGTIADKKACADQKLLEFIYENVSYPMLAKENNVQGNVVVSFVVNRDGSIEQANVVRDIGAGCGEEAKRVVNLMNQKGIKWSPGKQRGKTVRVQFLLPVRFKLL